MACLATGFMQRSKEAKWMKVSEGLSYDRWLAEWQRSTVEEGILGLSCDRQLALEQRG